MRTISEIRSGIRKESLSTKPLLADDYTYGNEDDQKTIIKSDNAEEIVSDENNIRPNKIKDRK